MGLELDKWASNSTKLFRSIFGIIVIAFRTRCNERNHGGSRAVHQGPGIGRRDRFVGWLGVGACVEEVGSWAVFGVFTYST